MSDTRSGCAASRRWRPSSLVRGQPRRESYNNTGTWDVRLGHPVFAVQEGGRKEIDILRTKGDRVPQPGSRHSATTPSARGRTRNCSSRRRSSVGGPHNSRKGPRAQVPGSRPSVSPLRAGAIKRRRPGNPVVPRSSSMHPLVRFVADRDQSMA
ncbi:hypothetical protein DAEQUDRAFT_132173 [Daedalea quercina L-15889]|uniref:Uncharacterized protein n=1 Tax=Daedalea quercina L-15889 TaxID=1314783 RepID=A0A165KQD0_9APHY|nr:hypothetical protein DAEQUDRAFT_132173 [Daedalea quercina L-15889]